MDPAAPPPPPSPAQQPLPAAPAPATRPVTQSASPARLPASSTDPVTERLAAFARDAAHGVGGRTRCACGHLGVLADRADGTVVRHGALVAKAHAPGTDPEAHRARLALAAHPAVAGVFLPPLPLPVPAARAGTRDDGGPVGAEVDGRPVTVWPYGPPVDPEDPNVAPWEEAARLLALLHRTPPPAALAPRLPAMRAPLKVALAVARMRATAPDHAAAATVLRAWRTVPADADAEAGADFGATVPGFLCHGDFHLGQLVRDARHPVDRPWRLIDIDDLGIGDPAWDLARPAAWFAAGLLPPDVWARFLGAYEAAGGPAVGPDPWSRLDLPARALTVQTAALALAKSRVEDRPLDEVEQVMIDTCARIAGD